jgi:hypothetical protein
MNSWIVAAVVFSLSTFALSQNIIDSTYGIGAGSFELGDVAGIPGFGYEDLPAGSTDITGWSIGGPLGITWLTSSPGGFNASDGNLSLDLTSSAGGMIWTDLPTTTGMFYTLTFDTGTLTGTHREGFVTISDINTVTTLLNETFLANEGPSIPYDTLTYNFTASGNSTRLLFGSTAPSGTPFGPVIDNVSVSGVSPVPEPSSALLVVAAVGCLCGRRRRSSVLAA